MEHSKKMNNSEIVIDPEAGKSTVGKIWYMEHQDVPLRDLGRVWEKTGEFVLQWPDGHISTCPGCWLSDKPNDEELIKE